MIATQSDFIPSIPDYTLLRTIGTGSYGEVHLARGVTGAYYAVKVVHRSRFEDDRPFAREFAGIQSYEPVSRSHDTQAAILHVGANQEQGFFYYVMELADDQTAGRFVDPCSYAPRTLQSDLKKCGRLPCDECVRIGLALSAGLDHMHRHGLVHRDIKPSNIIFLHGTPRLADPGLVTSVTSTRSFVGTQGYLPPEGPGSAQADIYSLGKVLYEISMGRDRNDYPELPTRLYEWPDHKTLVELNEIILKACHGDPRQRYQNAQQMHADLELLQAGHSVIEKRASERRISLIKKAATAGAILAGVATLAVWDRDRSARLEHARARMAEAEQLAGHGDVQLAFINYANAFRLVTPGSQDERIWRLRFGALMADCPQPDFSLPHPAPVNDAWTSPDGTWIATGCDDGCARIWRAKQTGVPPLIIRQADRIQKIRFSPDSCWLATSCATGPVRIWNTATARLCATLPDHKARVEEVCFAPSGKRIACARSDGVIQVCDVESGACVTPEISQPGVHGLGFSPDGHRLVAAGGGPQNGEVRIWDAMSGQAVATLPHSATVVTASFNESGTYVLTGELNGEIRLWNAHDGTLLKPAFTNHCPTIAYGFGINDNWVAMVGADQFLRIWDVAEGKTVSAPVKHTTPIRHLESSPDHKLLLTIEDGQLVRVWNAADAQPALAPIHCKDQIACAHFSPDSSQVVIACTDGMVRSYPVHIHGMVAAHFPVGGPIIHAEVSPTGDTIAAVVGEPSKPNAVTMVNLTNGVSMRLAAASEGPFLKTRISQNGAYVAGASLDGKVCVWDAISGQTVTAPLEHPFPVWQVRFDPRNRYLLTVCSTDRQPGEARVYDIKTGTLAYPALKHELEPMEAIYSPDGRFIATGSGSATGGGEARLWNAQNGQPSSPPIKQENAVWLLAISADSSKLAGAGMGNSAWIADVATGRVLVKAMKHESTITAIAFSPDGKRLMTAGTDQTIRFWQTMTGKTAAPTIRLATGVRDALFHPDGSLVLCGCADGAVSLWDSFNGSLAVPPHQLGQTPCLGGFRQGGSEWIATGDGVFRFRLQACELSKAQIQQLAAQIFGGNLSF